MYNSIFTINVRLYVLISFVTTVSFAVLVGMDDMVFNYSNGVCLCMDNNCFDNRVVHICVTYKVYFSNDIQNKILVQKDDGPGLKGESILRNNSVDYYLLDGIIYGFEGMVVRLHIYLRSCYLLHNFEGVICFMNLDNNILDYNKVFHVEAYVLIEDIISYRYVDGLSIIRSNFFDGVLEENLFYGMKIRKTKTNFRGVLP